MNETQLDEQLDERSVQLVARVRDGDQAAATEIFERYFLRLVRLVQTRLSPKLAQRVEADDVAQSVFRIFFMSNADERFVLERSGDLWRLLVGIAIKKIHHEVNRNSAQKRDFQRDQSLHFDDGVDLPIGVVVRDPTPDEAAAVAEQLELVFDRLSETEREVFLLRLEGLSDLEIAGKISRSQRTVRRAVEKSREMLETQLFT